MEANTLNLRDIYRKDTRYIVPMFQRPYVWNEEEHWRLLWDDMRQVVEDLIERREDADDEIEYEEAQLETSPHFLGAIVLDQLTNPTKNLETREIIDGQQRLITLQILLSAAHSVANDLGHTDEASMFEKLMYNDEDLIEDDDHRLKVWPIGPDQDAFREVMKNSTGSITSTSEDDIHQIQECYQFFRKEIEEWCAEGPQTEEERLNALRTTVWKLIRLVVIDLESNDDAQVIFETLNARGTPLLAADLIKNFLFREATRTRNPANELHEKYWKQFDEEEWREEISQGRLERPRIDVFIMHWLTMRTVRQVRAKKLFPEFQKYLKESDRAIEEVLQDIDHYAQVYRSFSEPYEDSREGKFFERLDVLDTTTPLPVLLWIYGEDAIPDDQRLIAIEAIESWIVRRMLCRVTSKNYNKIFLDLLDTLQDSDPEKVGRDVVEFFHSKEGESEYWPDNPKLTESMVQLEYWGIINQRRLRMVFTAIERELRDTGYSESLELKQNLQIEHILPQDWALNWPLPGERHEEVERIERDKAKDTIGNLTVLTDKLNPSVSNAAWEDKRDAIDEHTVILLNDKLIRNWFENWDEDTIAERGEWLSKIAATVWPGPNDDYWDD